MQLPDGRLVWLEQMAGWPVWGNAMPVAERVLEYPGEGAPIELTNNSDVIDALLSDWNAATACDGSAGTGGTTGTVPPTDDGDGDGLGSTSGDPLATSGAADGADADTIGCACTTGRDRKTSWAWLAFGLGLAWRRRRAA